MHVTLKRSTLIILTATACAFVLRLGFAWSAHIDRPIRGDAVDYMAYAANLLHHHVFSKTLGTSAPVPDSYRDPLYPMFLAGVVKVVAGADLQVRAIQNIQALLGALTVSAWLCLARRWLRPGWLALAGFLLAVWPHSITCPAYLLSETLLGFLLALALATIAAGLADNRLDRLATAGLLMGCAALTNAVLAPLMPALAFMAYLKHPSRRRACATLLLASLLLPGLWTVRNFFSASGQDAGQRAITNFVQGSWPEYHEAWRAALSNDAHGRATSHRIDDEVALAVRDRRAGFAAVIRRVGSEPGRFALWYTGKPALLWSWDMRIAAAPLYVFPTHESPIESRSALKASVSALAVLNPLIGLLALVGCGAILCRHDYKAGRAMAAMLIYVTVVYSLLQAEPRYAVPYRGAELVLAVTACAFLIGYMEARKRCPTTHLRTIGDLRHE
jgi:hypothetical protein